MNKIWNKDNSINIKPGDEFMDTDDKHNPLGNEGENLIKFPGITNIFFRLNSMWGHIVEFVSDEPLSEGFKAYFSIDESFTGEIEVYDSAKNFIRKCNINDLYKTCRNFSQKFSESVDNKIIRVTAHKRHIFRFIGMAEYTEGTRIIHIRPIVWNPEDIDVINRYYSYFEPIDMIENEVTIEILDMPESFSI
jgi:hypothetical protein